MLCGSPLSAVRGRTPLFSMATSWSMAQSICTGRIHMANDGGAAGTAAKAHVTRNKAAYIAGGAGLAAGALGGAALARRKQD